MTQAINTINRSTASTDINLGHLLSLPDEAKIDLIVKLTTSLKKEKVTEQPQDDFDYDAFLNSLSGDWGGADKTSEQVSAELRAARTFTRKVEPW